MGGYVGYQYPKVEAALYQVRRRASRPLRRALPIVGPRRLPPNADALLPKTTQDIVEIRKEKNLSSPERVGGNTFGMRLE